ncbi:MAG: hypothetical protein KJ061_13790, partial [Vicinamibacteraceae bacterium]|nr:hypothetical protein [Vicinamibacteraceae bacterium]
SRFSVGSESRTGEWIDYVAGVTWTLTRAGFVVDGFDALITSDVPLGCGLSSSAALEIATLRALREAFHLVFDDVRMARLAQQGENEFVGAPVGIMDQMCSALAVPGAALLLDTRSLEFSHVPLPAGADLVVVDSGVSHRLAEGDHGYATRRQQCEEAARQLGVALLRELDERDMARVDALPDVLRRRVRHVITENSRVHAAAAALQAGELEALGRLFAASHASMRDDYEVSVPEVDLLVDMAAHDPDVYGARLTGGGFGGAVVMFAKGGTGEAAAARIAERYAARSHAVPSVLVAGPAGVVAGGRKEQGGAVAGGGREQDGPAAPEGR